MQDTPAQAQQAERSSTIPVTFPLIPRMLALGGAALFAVAAWLPWAIVYFAPAGSSSKTGTSVLLSLTPRWEGWPPLTPGTVGAPPLNSLLPGQGALFVWSALTVFGIPLAALAWMRVRRSMAWLIAGVYGLWLLVTLVFSFTSARYLLQSTTFSFQTIGGAAESTTVGVMFDSPVTHDPQIGLWLSGIALLLCLAGLWAQISATRRFTSSLESPARSARPAAQTPGAGALTFGLVLWAVGFLWLAWASLGCPSFVLVSAECKGITADGAMTYAISRANPLALDPRAGEFAISILLALGALFIGVGVWRRGVSGALCGWATIWLVAAAAFAALAWYGVNLVINDPSQGSWRSESGILFTAAALLICLAGVGLLWFALLFHRIQTRAA